MAEQQNQELKPTIVNAKDNVSYTKGNFLGKGGFAKCYEFKNKSTGETFAGKVVSKSMLVKPHHKAKMFQEIQIHSTLSHMYIVALHSYFEDENNVYIILELCRKRSLMEMHKRRKTLTVPEVRYFMKQILLACKYMHENKVIHRDLKLGNLFINDDMEVKVGDFGLATRVSFEGERKKTLCGTPNYIAPEILTKKGHSYEVDIWSLGCIMFTLLVGMPPFETKTLRTTYTKIKKCEYLIPIGTDPCAKALIKKLLHPDPGFRPSADQILADDFFARGYIPSRLPVSCLTMQPRFSKNISICDTSRISSDRRVLSEVNTNRKLSTFVEPFAPIPENIPVAGKAEAPKPSNSMPQDYYIGDLFKMIDSIIACQPEKIYTGQPEDAQDPSLVPFVWISKWVDYTDKYGIGYQLCDNSIGVSFNDSTHLVLVSKGENYQYVERNGDEQYHDSESLPHELKKKVTLLKYFSTYMNDNLLKAGESAMPREGDELTQVPHLRSWFRTKSAIVFHLTNGTLQVNFFRDHTKIIMCPIMGAVSFIDENKEFTVYNGVLIKKHGCPSILATRLRYARSMVEKLLKDLQQPSAKK